MDGYTANQPLRYTILLCPLLHWPNDVQSFVVKPPEGKDVIQADEADAWPDVFCTNNKVSIDIDEDKEYLENREENEEEDVEENDEKN